MSTANAFTSRRRQLLLGALTVLLHLLVFHWFSHRTARLPDAPAHAAPTALVAELLSTPPPAPPPAVPPPQPAFDEPPLPDVAPEPVEPAPPPAAPATPATANAPVLDGDLAAGADTSGGPAGQQAAAAGVGAPASQPDKAAAETPPAPAPAAQPAPPAAPAAPPGPRFKVDMPPSSDITLAVARTDANGAKWSGDQSLSWTVTPSSYRIQIDAGIRIMFAHVNLLSLTSEGKVGDVGFVPILMTEKRRGRSMTATHFNRANNTLTFSATEWKYPLEPDVQDKATVPLQLTAIARGDPQQLTGTFNMQVGEDRDAVVYTFTVAGHEPLDTPLGKLDTLHLVRPPKQGAYHARLDLWLAPAYGWYPVQIRSTEQTGAVTTQTATKIEIKQAGS